MVKNIGLAGAPSVSPLFLRARHQIQSTQTLDANLLKKFFVSLDHVNARYKGPSLVCDQWALGAAALTQF